MDLSGISNLGKEKEPETLKIIRALIGNQRLFAKISGMIQQQIKEDDLSNFFQVIEVAS